MGYGMCSGMGSDVFLWWLLQGLLFIIAAYVFSYIFWGMKKHLEQKPKKKKKK